MSRKLLWAFAAVLLLVAAPAFGASQNAALYGTVYDASGNPMPGVTVTLENPALAFSRTTTSGSDGTFNFAEVPPAENYKLTAAKGGKKLDIRAGLSVNVGDERIILPPLREQAVAATGQAVEKTAERAVTTESASTSISGVITGEQLRSLPLYNRNFLALGLLTPETHDVEANNTLAGASFSVAGNRANNNNFLLDGVDNVAANNNQSLPFQVNDSIQEFRVTSSNAPAEYGRNQGGTVNVVTKRAGNTFHGSAFGYFGGGSLNADNAVSLYNGSTFDKAAAYAGSTTAPLITPFPNTYNDYVATAAAFGGYCTDSLSAFTGVAGTVTCFGGGAGGTGENTLFDPAAILATNNKFKQPFSSQQFGINMGGALMKDKLFLFASYEATRINNPNAVFERVPSTFDKTYNPLGVVPNYFFTPTNNDFLVGQGVLSLFPASNVVGVPQALEFFRGQTPNYTHVHNGLFRADYIHSDKSSWTFRYAVQGLNQLHDDTLPATGSYPGNGAFRGGLNQNLKVSYNYIFSPTLLNEMHFGITRFNLEETPQDAGFNFNSLAPAGVVFPSNALPTFLLSGLDTQYSGATNAAFGGFGSNGAFGGWADCFIFGCSSVIPAPTLDGLFPFARIGAPLNAPSDRRDTTWFIGDNVSWSKGKHAVRFGADFRHLDNRLNNGGFSRGYVTSGNIGEFTSDSLTCNDNCGNAFFAPSFDYALRQSSPYSVDFHSYAFSAFIQDTWRFHPRWTLNYGVRYEYFSPPEERNDQIWNFDPVANGLVQQGHSTTTDPYGHSCAATAQYETWAPAFIANALIPPQPWTCSAVGNGKLQEADVNNFAPRFGLAWDLFGNGRTVLRAGYGLFYDQVPIYNIAQLMYNRPTPSVLATATVVPQLLYGQFANGAVSNAYGNSSLDPAVSVANGNATSQSASSPFAMYARNVKNSHAPFTHQYNFTLQQQVTDHLVGEIGYVGSSGRLLPVMSNSGFNNEWFCTSSAGGCDTNGFFPVFTLTNQGQSSYHSLMVRARVAGWHGFRTNVTYVWSKSIDNASNGYFPTLPVSLFNQGNQLFASNLNVAAECLGAFFFSCPGTFPGVAPTGENLALTTTGARAALTSPYNIPQDPYNFLINDLARSDFNSNHRFVMDYTWDVPSLQKKWGWSKWLDYWQFAGIFVAQSGQPFTIFSGPISGEVTQRANITGPITLDMGNSSAAIGTSGLEPASVACLSNTGSAFIGSGSLFSGVAGTPCTGNSGRNQFTGPNFLTLNMSIQKGFPIGGENRMLNFRAEFYNLSNRANFYNPISALTVDGFNLNPDFGKIKSAHDPRQIQFGVRYNW